MSGRQGCHKHFDECSIQVCAFTLSGGVDPDRIAVCCQSHVCREMQKVCTFFLSNLLMDTNTRLPCIKAAASGLKTLCHDRCASLSPSSEGMGTAG